ncbi:hypothetical protein KKF61_06800 [Patescibacteria group bacterium]|nr:hypothetical protein [Patescibacteria group bacterium]MBU0963704.1 hypothetical protein [Patescibacteria group bacterium]
MKTSNNFPNKFGGNGFKPERIKIDAKCPVCGSMYDFGHLEVLQEEEGATLMFIKCTVCQSAAMSLIAFGTFGLKVASAVTDLEQDEVLMFQEYKPINSEEVLSLHEDLESTDNFLKEII